VFISYLIKGHRFARCPEGLQQGVFAHVHRGGCAYRHCRNITERYIPVVYLRIGIASFERAYGCS
jgi:hypothetical protein